MLIRFIRLAQLTCLLLVCNAAVAQGPPVETGPFRKPDLVELIKLDPAIRLDIRYATRNNFLSKAVTRIAARRNG